MDSGILSNIGQTPLQRLRKLFSGAPGTFYAKLEMFNPGGSIKDRPARKMLNDALQEGRLQPGDTVVESSSGNMAIGLAQACRYHGLNLVAVVDPKINPHTRKILQAYGAEIEEVTEADEHGNYLESRLDRVRGITESIPGAFWPNQYANSANPAAHYQTMHEIVQQLGSAPDYLLTATSTCGTIMGCTHYLKEHDLYTKVIAVDAVGSVIFGSPSADRLVPGHGAGRESDLLDKSLVDRVIHINDEECVTGCRRLLRHEAILAGGSSGAVITAAEKLKNEFDKGSTCALILADSGERYLDTIYNDAWVRKHFGSMRIMDAEAVRDTETVIPIPSDNITDNGHKKDTHKIAIIGGGPKGMYGFERLAARFSEHPPGQNVEIHVYNRNENFGAGSIYRPGQPPCQLINNPVGDINMWIDENPEAVVSEPRSLTSWLQQNGHPEITDDDYVSRGEVGRYLTAGFRSLAERLPCNVSGQYLIAEVTDIEEENEHYRLTVRATDGSTQKPGHRYDHILLATGHPRNQPTSEEKQWQAFVGDHDTAGFMPFIYPVESSLSSIAPQSLVGIKGIGLTFVDAVLALTEGRGGTFERNANTGGLSYEPSGREPGSIYPFSRSGLPMIPRGPAPKHPVQLQFFTEDAIEKLHKQSGEAGLCFRENILPLLEKELTFAYYHIRLKNRGAYATLTDCDSFSEIEHHIENFHRQHPQEERFTPEKFLQPLLHVSLGDGASFQAWVEAYLHFWIGEAKIGELQSPWAAVTSVWRKITPMFSELYSDGGLNPSSQAYFDRSFRRLLNRVTFGPPTESVEKLAALIDAGILRFHFARNPIVDTDESEGAFTLHIEQRNDTKHVSFLIDARIPKVSVAHNRSPLYRNLLDRGLARLFTNDAGDQAYQPGCIDISQQGYLIDAQGNENRTITVTGTPTEGVTFDNDALARSRNNLVSGWARTVASLYSQSTLATRDHR